MSSVYEVPSFSVLQLGNFLKENRRLQGLKLEQVSQSLLIKKVILKQLEAGDIDISDNYASLLDKIIIYANSHYITSKLPWGPGGSGALNSRKL